MTSHGAFPEFFPSMEGLSAASDNLVIVLLGGRGVVYIAFLIWAVKVFDFSEALKRRERLL
jgi:hypothetical protein